MWDAFLREITRLDNKELREVGGSRVPWKRPSLAVEVDKYGGAAKEEETAKEIASLKRWLVELRVLMEVVEAVEGIGELREIK